METLKDLHPKVGKLCCLYNLSKKLGWFVEEKCVSWRNIKSAPTFFIKTKRFLNFMGGN